jgi:hypothetical protein
VEDEESRALFAEYAAMRIVPIRYRSDSSGPTSKVYSIDKVRLSFEEPTHRGLKGVVSRQGTDPGAVVADDVRRVPLPDPLLFKLSPRYPSSLDEELDLTTRY